MAQWNAELSPSFHSHHLNSDPHHLLSRLLYGIFLPVFVHVTDLSKCRSTGVHVLDLSVWFLMVSFNFSSIPCIS